MDCLQKATECFSVQAIIGNVQVVQVRQGKSSLGEARQRRRVHVESAQRQFLDLETRRMILQRLEQ